MDMDTLLKYAPAIVGNLIGGAITFGIAKQRMFDFQRRIELLEKKDAERENSEKALGVRLTVVETVIKERFDSLGREFREMRDTFRDAVKEMKDLHRDTHQ